MKIVRHYHSIYLAQLALLSSNPWGQAAVMDVNRIANSLLSLGQASRYLDEVGEAPVGDFSHVSIRSH
jgi:hypothetical protein